MMVWSCVDVRCAWSWHARGEVEGIAMVGARVTTTASIVVRRDTGRKSAPTGRIGVNGAGTVEEKVTRSAIAQTRRKSVRIFTMGDDTMMIDRVAGGGTIRIGRIAVVAKTVADMTMTVARVATTVIAIETVIVVGPGRKTGIGISIMGDIEMENTEEIASMIVSEPAIVTVTDLEAVTTTVLEIVTTKGTAIVTMTGTMIVTTTGTTIVTMRRTARRTAIVAMRKTAIVTMTGTATVTTRVIAIPNATESISVTLIAIETTTTTTTKRISTIILLVATVTVAGVETTMTTTKLITMGEITTIPIAIHRCMQARMTVETTDKRLEIISIRVKRDPPGSSNELVIRERTKTTREILRILLSEWRTTSPNAYSIVSV